MTRVYLKSLDLMNVGPFEKLHLEFGPSVNVIAGRHAVGKTTCVESIKSFFAGGAAPELIRHGTTEAQAHIEWADGMKATKTLKLGETPEDKDTYDVEVIAPSGQIRKRYAEALAERVPKGSFSPSAFLKADPRERADFLVKHLNISFTSEEVNKILAPEVIPGMDSVLAEIEKEVIVQPLSGVVDLKLFDNLVETVYESRRKVNVADRDCQGAIADLRKTLPDSTGGKNWAQERDRLQAEVVEIEKEIAAKAADIRTEAEQARSAKRTEIEQKIADLQRELSDYIRATDIAEADSIRERTAELNERKVLVSVDLGNARAHADQETKAAGTREAIAKREAESKNLISKERRRTRILERLEKIKHLKLKDIPIDGLDIKFDKKRPVITVNRTPIEELSGQESMFLGFQCVLFAAGEYPLVLEEGDGLMEEYIKILANACDAAPNPVQVILARHSEGGELRVVHYGRES